MALEEYKDIVATVASIVTIGQFFAPAFICLDIAKKKSTKDVDPTPFIGGLVMCVLTFQYGFMLKDAAMLQVNVVGFGLGLVYLYIYYLYTSDKGPLNLKTSKAVALVAVLLGYARIESEEKVEFRFGAILTVLMLMLVGAPLLQLGEIVRKKSTAGLPFPLILSGTVVSFSWLLYGIILKNIFMQFQNVVVFVLCLVQLSLFAIYPSGSVEDSEPEKKKL